VIALGLLLACNTLVDPTERSPCLPGESEFRDQVWDPVAAVTCIACHTRDGIAGDTRLVLVDDDDALAENLARWLDFAAREVEGQPLLLLKPSGEHPEGHTGGIQLPPGSDGYLALQTFIGRATGADCEGPEEASCVRGEPGDRRLRRLTPDELSASIQDLLGLHGDFAGRLAADPAVGGWSNHADALVLDRLQAEQVQSLAEEVAGLADLEGLLPCAGEDEACARTFVARFGLRAFRRPLTPDDEEAYVALWSQVAVLEGFDAGIRFVIEAMLQSPHFLYRSELGARDDEDRFALSDWELATALSYLVTASTPDDPLLAAAAAGELSDPAGLADQLARLLATVRADEGFRRFTVGWLQVEPLGSVSRDKDTYPEFSTVVRDGLDEELRRLAGQVFSQGGELGELLGAEQTLLDASLAEFYGVAEPLEVGLGGYGLVTLDEPGVLGRGAVMATHAQPTGSSPVHRGQLVRERLLCQDLPEPPANLETAAPQERDDQTTRERYAAHSEQPECAVCHELMDPIGFALEHHDGVGRWRDRDGGGSIDASGAITRSLATDADFVGGAELAQVLAGSDEVEACLRQQWTRWAFGSDELALDCAERDLAELHDGSLPGLIEAAAQLVHFQARVGGADEADGPAAEDLAAPGAWGDPEGWLGESSAPGDVDPDQPLSLQWEVSSSWSGGWCADVVVENVGDDPLTWALVAELGGPLDSWWSAQADPLGSRVRFSGDWWNLQLAPGEATDFGFCVGR